MTVSYPLALTLLLLTCIFSFAWAMRYFFVRMGETSRWLRITIVVGGLISVLNIAMLWHSSHLRPLCVAVAAALYLLALLIFWWAIKANRAQPLSACFAPDEPLHLVQHGPYRLVRHPFYCSYLLTWLGGCVATLSLWLCISYAVMFVLYLIAACSEERKFASSRFAQQYGAYKRATGRFFPNPAKIIALHYLP